METNGTLRRHWSCFISLNCNDLCAHLHWQCPSASPEESLRPLHWGWHNWSCHHCSQCLCPPRLSSHWGTLPWTSSPRQCCSRIKMTTLLLLATVLGAHNSGDTNPEHDVIKTDPMGLHNICSNKLIQFSELILEKRWRWRRRRWPMMVMETMKTSRHTHTHFRGMLEAIMEWYSWWSDKDGEDNTHKGHWLHSIQRTLASARAQFVHVERTLSARVGLLLVEFN